MKGLFKYIMVTMLLLSLFCLSGQSDSRYDAGMNLPFNEREGDYNPQTGSINLSFTDLKLPGRAGYDFSFGREWSLNRANIFNMYEELGQNRLNSNTVERYARMGVGWTGSLPYIMEHTDSSHRVLNLIFGGSTFEIDQDGVTVDNPAKSNLLGYDLTDMRIFKDSAISYGDFDSYAATTPGLTTLTLAELKSRYGLSDRGVDRNGYRLVMKSNESYYFREDGLLMMQQDKSGLNRIWYLYEKATPAGRARLKLVVDTIGREIRFGYDGDGNLNLLEWDVKVGVKEGASGRKRAYEEQTRAVRFYYSELESALDGAGNSISPKTALYRANDMVIEYKKSYLLRAVSDPMGNMTKYDYREGEAAFSFDSSRGHYSNLYLLLTGISANYTTTDGKYKSKRVFDYETPAKGLYKKYFYRGYMEHYRLTGQYNLNRHGREMMRMDYLYFQKGEQGNMGEYSTVVKMDGVERHYFYTLSESKKEDHVLNRIVTKSSDGFNEVKSFFYNFDRTKAGETVARAGTTVYSESFLFDAKGNLKRHVDRTGLITEKSYHDKYGLPLTVTMQLKDAAGSPLEYRSETVVNSLGQVTEQKLFINKGGVTAPVTLSTTGYDSYGNPISKKDAAGNIHHTVYDSEYSAFPVKLYQDLRIASWTTAGDVHANWKSEPTGTEKVRIRSWKLFNSDGSLWIEVDNEGYAVEHYYDKAGRELERVNPDGDDLITFAAPIKVNPNGTIVGTDFDNFLLNPQFADFLTSRENNPGARMEIDYQADFVRTFSDIDRAQGLIKVSGKQGNGLGNVEEETLYKKVGTGYEPYSVKRMSYDSYGRVIAITDPDADLNTGVAAYINGTRVQRYDKTWLIKYDALGRKSKVYYPNDGTGSPSKSIIYDDLANTVTTVDPENVISRQYFDWKGSLLKTTIYKDAALVESEALSYSFVYDELKRKIRFTDAMGLVTEYFYDERNLLTEQRHLSDGGSDIMVYDDLGRLTEKIDRKGQIITLSYDELGRELETLHYKSAADRLANVVAHRVSKSYDNRGNAVRISNPNLTEHYLYDHGNRVIKLERKLKDTETINLLSTKGDWVSTNADNHIYSFSYSYNEGGLITSMQYPNGEIHRYDYESSLLRLDRIREGESEAVLSDFVSSLSYNRSGAVTSMSYSNGTSQHWSFDNRKMINGIRIDGAAGTISELNYKLNGSGNITEINNNRYSYDSFNRLISAKTQLPKTEDKRLLVMESFGTYNEGDPIGGRFYNLLADMNSDGRVNGRDHYLATLTDRGALYDEESFTYDMNGNRQTLTQNGDSYRYEYLPGKNRLSKVFLKKKGAALESLFAEYLYDENGNTIKRTIHGAAGAKIITFDYDTMNRLVKTTDESGKVTTYLYDNAGNRLSKKTATKLTIYLRHGQIAVAQEIEVDTGAAASSYKVNRYLLSGDLLAGRISSTYLNRLKTGSERFYYHLDHLNSTRAVTKADGTVEVIYEYRAFGEQLKRLDAAGADTTDKARYSYGGKELDDNSNLYYFNARYYDATTGRFINVDPIQDGTNWYIYCINNPLTSVDPTGLAVFHINRSKDPERMKFHRSGWGHDAPQKIFGYNDKYDDNMHRLGFTINAAKMQAKGFTLRLWKGDYDWAGKCGGEIGIYSSKLGRSMTKVELYWKLGLKSTTMDVYAKKDDKFITGYTENKASFWTTAFHGGDYDREDVYTVNIFRFKSVEHAEKFYKQLQELKNDPGKYEHNGGESLKIVRHHTNVKITWGREENKDKK